MSRSTPSLAFALLCSALLPEAAAACSVCYGGGEETRNAFILTTVFLSALPLAMVGSLAWWIWRRMREAEAAS
jgi:di/tricarboxylate transporter